MVAIKSWLVQDPDTGNWKLFTGSQSQNATGSSWTAAKGAEEVESFRAATPPPPSDIQSYVLQRDPNVGYGLKFGGPVDESEGDSLGFGVFVKAIRPGTPAEVAGIEVGLQVVTMGGVDLTNSTFVDLNAAVQSLSGIMAIELRPNQELYRAYNSSIQRRGSFTVMYPQSGSTLIDASNNTVKVTVEADEDGYGIQFGGARDQEDGEKHGYGIFIAGTVNGSAASKYSELGIGLQIITVNGVYLKNKTFVELKDALTGAHENKLELELTENLGLFHTYRNLRESISGSTPSGRPASIIGLEVEDGERDGAIEIKLTQRPGEGFGLKFGGAKNDNDANEISPGIFLSGTKPNTVADEHPQVKNGLQITRINGVDMRQGTFETLKRVLSAATSDTMTLVLEENPALAAKYTEAIQIKKGPALIKSVGESDSHKIILNKRPEGFGLKFGGAVDDGDGNKHGFGVYISGIVEGSVAAEHPGIRVNRQIINMNGIDLLDRGTFEGIRTALKQGDPNTLELELVDNLPLAEKYIALKKEDANEARTTARLMRRASLHSSPSAVPPQKSNVITVSLPRSDQGYGLKFAGAQDKAEARVKGGGIVISGTKAGSAAADDDEIKVGLQLVSVNGVDLEQGCLQDLKAAIAVDEEGLEMELKENPELVERFVANGKLKPVAKEVTVTLHRSDTGYGLKFGGARDRDDALLNGAGVYISGTKPDSPASKMAQIVPGLQVIELNGTNIASGTFEDLKSVLSSAENQLSIVLKENKSLVDRYVAVQAKSGRTSMHAPSSNSNEPTITVTLARSDNGYGLKFGGARSAKDAAKNGAGVFISGTKPGSVAAQCSDISDGMQIVKMNGTDLSNGTFDDLKAVLSSAGSELSMVLRNNNDLVTKYHVIKTRDGRRSLHASKFISNRGSNISKPPTINESPAPGVVITTTLEKGEGGWGIVFEGAKSVPHGEETMFGVFVGDVKPDSSAANNEDIETGMQLLSINGTDLREATFEDLKVVLRSVGFQSTLTLELTHNPDLVAAHTK